MELFLFLSKTAMEMAVENKKDEIIKLLNSRK